jgi:hypothetical protein
MQRLHDPFCEFGFKDLWNPEKRRLFFNFKRFLVGLKKGGIQPLKPKLK